ncbi:MAG: hypothetical protein B7Z45_01515 [Azorhizobium sp. 12-66-6]|nr:MAG: hypothetical protein B7Z45_01515 [Azorhizobium sp. 12-66-6]
MRKTLSLIAAASLSAAFTLSGAQAQPLRPAPAGLTADAGSLTNVQWHGPRGPGWRGPGWRGPGPRYYGPRYGYRNCGWGGCNNNGAAVAAGVVGGLMLGAAAASAANAANSAPPQGMAGSGPGRGQGPRRPRCRTVRRSPALTPKKKPGSRDPGFLVDDGSDRVSVAAQRGARIMIICRPSSIGSASTLAMVATSSRSFCSSL